MEASRIWHADDLGGLELMRATFTEFTFTPHAHEEFMIAVTEDGLARPTYRGDTHAVGPGDVIVLNPEEPHAGGPAAEALWTYRGLYPAGRLMLGIAEEFSGASLPEFRGDLVRDSDVAARLRRFHKQSEAQEPTALQRESDLMEALVLLVGRHAVGRRQPKRVGGEREAVRITRDFLEAHAEENISLSALAEIAGLSPFHLCRVFRRDVGLAPHAFQIQVRIRRAKALLRSGLGIATVAAETGFYDQPHLTRYFKRVVGVTPGQYAKGAVAS